LCVDPKKDYGAPLHVDCSVEYDLPRVVRPPPGAQPLLMLAPRSASSSASAAAAAAAAAAVAAASTAPYLAVWNGAAIDWSAASTLKAKNGVVGVKVGAAVPHGVGKHAAAAVARPMLAAPAPNLSEYHFSIRFLSP